MDKKKFWGITVSVIILSLTFVPTKICYLGQCTWQDWEFITGKVQPYIDVDYSRLLLELIAIGIVLRFVWVYKVEKNPIVDKVKSESKNDPKQNIKNVNETNKYSPNKNDFFVALATKTRKILNDFFQIDTVSKFIKNKNYRVKRVKSQEYVIFPNLEAAIKRNGFIFIYHSEDDCLNAIQKGELTLRAKEVLKNI